MANIVIDTTSSTENSITFNVVNFGSTRLIEITVKQGNTEVWYNKPYFPQFTNATFTVENLSPGTTYTVRAYASPDDVSKNITTQGSPAPTPTDDKDYWGSPWGASAWGGMWIGNITTSSTGISGVVRVSKDNILDLSGIVRVKRIAEKDIAGVVDVKNSISKDIEGKVRIEGPSYSNIEGTVNIYKPSEQVSSATISGKIMVDATSSSSLPGAVRISSLPEASIAGGVNICRVKSSDIAGLARIERSIPANISGKVKIRVAIPEKLPEKWDYDNNAGPNEWESLNKPVDQWQKVDKGEETWSSVDTIATDWSEDANSEPENWAYPLEDNS